MPSLEELLASRAEEYVAVASDGRLLAGPFLTYGEAKSHADAAGGYVRFLAEEGKAQDFDSPEAAVDHEKARGGVMGAVGDGIYVFYPDGLARRIYYSAGKYHVARRAEPVVRGKTHAAVEESSAPRGGYAGTPTPIYTARYKKKKIAVRYWPTDHDNGRPYMSTVEDDPTFTARWLTQNEAVAGIKKEIDERGKPRVKKRPPVLLEGAKAAEDFTIAQRDVKAVRAGRKKGSLKNARDVYAFVHEELVKYSQEVVLVIPLDHRGQPLNPKPYVVAMGQRAEVNVNIEDVLRPVIETNAQGFVVCHNHPSGRAVGSPADKELTDRIRKGAEKGCPTAPMLDHVVIGDGQFYSFGDKKLYEVAP